MAFDDLSEKEKLKAIFEGINNIKSQLDKMSSGQVNRNASLTKKVDELSEEIKKLTAGPKENPE